MIIDDEEIFCKLKEKAESIRVPNEVSVILVSVPHRTIMEEFMVPLTKRRSIEHLFKGKVRIEERNRTDCRSIVTDELLQRGCVVSYSQGSRIGTEMLSLPLDFSISVKEKNEENYIRSFFTISVDDASDNEGVRREVYDWFTKALACFHIGYKDRLSLVIDDQDIYYAITEDISKLKIQDDFSVILVSMNTRKQEGEKNPAGKK